MLAELGIERGSPEHVKIREVLKPFPTELHRRVNNPTEAERSKRLTARELYAAVESELVVELKQVLKPQQFTRLQQIHWQHHGIQALSDPELAISLGITDDQRQQLAAAKLEVETQRTALEKQRDEMRAKGEGTEEVQKKIQDLETQKTQKDNDILTAQQQSKFAMMLGKRFDMPQPERPASVNRGRPIQTRPGGLMALAIREPVLKELGIDNEAPEVAEIRKLMVAHSTEFRKKLFELSPPDREKATEIESSLQAKYDPDLKKLLKPEQYERLKQDALAAAGSRSS